MGFFYICLDQREARGSSFEPVYKRSLKAITVCLINITLVTALVASVTATTLSIARAFGF